MRRVLASFLIYGFFFASPCFANEELAAKSRLATRQDVLGEQQLVYQVVSPKANQDSGFFSEYQWWSFSSDGYVKNVAVDEEHFSKTANESLLSMLFQTMPKQTRFEFRKDGVLTIERSPTDKDFIVISIITDDMETPLRQGAPLLKQDDLLLSYLTPRNQLYMQRFLRRVHLSGSEQ